MQMGEWWTGNDVGTVKRMVGIELVAIVNSCELPTGLLQSTGKQGAQQDGEKVGGRYGLLPEYPNHNPWMASCLLYHNMLPCYLASSLNPKMLKDVDSLQ